MVEWNLCFCVLSFSHRVGWWCAGHLWRRSHGHCQSSVHWGCLHSHDVPARQGHGKTFRNGTMSKLQRCDVNILKKQSSCCNGASSSFFSHPVASDSFCIRLWATPALNSMGVVFGSEMGVNFQVQMCLGWMIFTVFKGSYKVNRWLSV